MKRVALLLTTVLAFSNQLLAEDNVVEIAYSGTTATVTIADNIASYVTLSSGTSSHVVLTQTNTSAISTDNDEIIYRLSGTSLVMTESSVTWMVPQAQERRRTTKTKTLAISTRQAAR